MDKNNLTGHFLRAHPRNAARTLEKFPVEAVGEYFAEQPVPLVAGVVQHMVPAIVSRCLQSMPTELAAEVLMHLDIERAAALLRRIPLDQRELLIHQTSTIFANMIRLVMGFPDDSVGRIMNPDVFTVHQDLRVSEVITAARNAAEQLQHEIYVIDDQQHPVGVVVVKQLLTTAAEEKMKNIMQSVRQVLSARTSLAAAVRNVAWEQSENIPVVDHQGVCIGVLQRNSLLAKDAANHQVDEYAGTAIAMAEMFWDTCAQLLLPAQEKTKNEVNSQ